MKTLIFIYNADSGLLNSLSDMAHKIFSPETYQCNLCAVTYSNFGMRKAWKQFLQELGYEYEFLHRDECLNRYDLPDIALPAVLLKTDQQPEIILDANTINQCHDLNALSDVLRAKLKSHV